MPGEGCFVHVLWAMQTGIYKHPAWYPGLTTQSPAEDFQRIIHDFDSSRCPEPCPRMNTTMSEVGMATPEPGAANGGACHTAMPGDECFTHLLWVMQTGIYNDP